MASTLTRTAAAFAVASLPFIAGASVAQASDSSPSRDFCKGNDSRKEKCEPRNGEHPKLERRSGNTNHQREYTRPTPKKTYEPRHEESHGEKYDRTRRHTDDDDHKYKKPDYKKDDDH